MMKSNEIKLISKDNVNILNRIKKLESAHHAIIVPLQSKIEKVGEYISDKLKLNDMIQYILLIVNDEKKLIIDDFDSSLALEQEQEILIEDFIRFKKYLSDNHKNLRIIIDNFEKLDLKEQCDILAISRGIRETTDKNSSYQLIVCGAWNYFSLNKYFRDNKNSSPPFNTRNIHYIPYLNTTHITQLLYGKRCIKRIPPDESEKYICEIITETTGGDRFVCNHVIDILEQKKITDFEDVLCTLPREDSVETNIKNRISDISSEAQKMLLTLSHTQFIEVDNDDIPAEELKMLSIVKTVLPYSRKQIIGFLSPVIADIIRSELRVNFPEVELPNVTFYEDKLMFTENFTNIAAFSLVTRIENTLRNLVVLALEVDENSWLDTIGENVKLYNEKLRIKEIISKRRKEANSHIELLSEASISFLTTNELKEIICNKHLYMDYFKKYFNNREDKSEIGNLLDTFKNIRNTIAHNRFVSYTMVIKLEEIHKTLVKYIGQYGKQLLMK